MALENSGGSNSSPNKAPAQKVLESALANRRVARDLIAALGGHSTSAIIATSTSQTVDFGSVKAGDFVAHIPSTAGNASFRTAAADGSFGAAAVVGDLYIVLHAVNLDNDLMPTAPLI